MKPRHVQLKGIASFLLCLLLAFHAASGSAWAQTTPPAPALIPVGTTDKATTVLTRTETQRDNYPSYYQYIRTSGGGFTLNDADGSVTVPASELPADYTADLYYQFQAPVNGVQSFTHKTFKFTAVKLTAFVNNFYSGMAPGNTATMDVIVGQQMTAKTSLEPAAVAAGATYQWTIGGDKIKEFKKTDWVRDTTPNDGVDNEIRPKSEAVDLSTADLKTAGFSFYFTKGTFAGVAVDVKVTVTIGGKTIIRSGTCKVSAPEFVSFTSNWSSLNPPWDIRLENNMTLLSLGVPASTPAQVGITNGINWAASANVPSGWSGDIGFCQLVSPYHSLRYSGSPARYFDSGGTPILDAPGDMMYRTLSVGGGNSTLRSDDSPGQGMDGTINAAVADSFKLYFMYRPTGGIWVTIGLLSWDATASATYHYPVPATPTTPAVAGYYTVDPNAVPAAPGAGPANSDLPSWNDSGEALKARSGM